MSLFENFPYTNLHNLNLDWIVQKIQELNDKFDEAISAKIKFANPIEWDITKQYEQLTIVINDDKAYLSMQPVPSGIEITNEDYWQNIFDMSELYQMIADLEQQLTDDIEDLRDDMEEADETLDNKIDTDIQALSDITIKNNSVKHVLFVGDSYTVWNSNELYNSFVENCGVPAAQCHNVAVSGASFNDDEHNYITQIMNYSGNKTEITDIIVAGGINDALLSYNVDTFPSIAPMLSRMQAFATYANNNYPNAQLHLAFIGGCLCTSDYYTSLHPAKSQEMALFGYTQAVPYGFHIMHTYNTIHTTPVYYGSDGLHPNASGAAALGLQIASEFNHNHIPDIRPKYRGTETYEAGAARTGEYKYNVSVIEDVTEITFEPSYFLCNNAAQIGVDFVQIASITNNNWRPKSAIYISITALLNGFTDTAAYHPVPANIKIEDGKIYLSLKEVVGNSYKTFTAPNQNCSVTLPGFTFTTKTFNIN